MIADFTTTDEGSIILLMPRTAAARLWVDEYLPDNALRWGRAVCIEPRCFADIAYGILSEGMSLQDTATGVFACSP